MVGLKKPKNDVPQKDGTKARRTFHDNEGHRTSYLSVEITWILEDTQRVPCRAASILQRKRSVRNKFPKTPS